jgi:hypothetical protein
VRSRAAHPPEAWASSADADSERLEQLVEVARRRVDARPPVARARIVHARRVVALPRDRPAGRVAPGDAGAAPAQQIVGPFDFPCSIFGCSISLPSFVHMSGWSALTAPSSCSCWSRCSDIGHDPGSAGVGWGSAGWSTVTVGTSPIGWLVTRSQRARRSGDELGCRWPRGRRAEADGRHVGVSAAERPRWFFRRSSWARESVTCDGFATGCG